MNIRTKHTNNPLTFGLALAAGIGVILMILALAIGVIQGATADANALGLVVLGGLILLIVGVGGWVGVVQPYRNFDDINQPKDSGHHGHAAPSADAAHATEPEAEAHAVVVTAHAAPHH